MATPVRPKVQNINTHARGISIKRLIIYFSNGLGLSVGFVSQILTQGVKVAKKLSTTFL